MFVPTQLGVALILGFDRMNFETSLGKPFLRKEMELKMKAISEGRTTRAVVLRESIAQYRQVFLQSQEKLDVLKAVSCLCGCSCGQANADLGVSRIRLRSRRLKVRRSSDVVSACRRSTPTHTCDISHLEHTAAVSSHGGEARSPASLRTFTSASY